MAEQKRRRFNFAAAFVAFTKGASLAQISANLAIPLTVLESKHRNENWFSMASKMAVEVQQGSIAQRSSAATEARLAKIEENREANFRMFAKLREDFCKQVDALLRDEARVQKSWNNRGEVVTHEAPLSTGDRVNLATYARTIAEGTYSALGDRVSGSGAKDGPGDGSPPPPAVTIILPAAIALPRHERSLPQGGVIIDMREKAPQILDAVEVTPKAPIGADTDHQAQGHTPGHTET